MILTLLLLVPLLEGFLRVSAPLHVFAQGPLANSYFKPPRGNMIVSVYLFVTVRGGESTYGLAPKVKSPSLLQSGITWAAELSME